MIIIKLKNGILKITFQKPIKKYQEPQKTVYEKLPENFHFQFTRTRSRSR